MNVTSLRMKLIDVKNILIDRLGELDDETVSLASAQEVYFD